MEKQKTDLRITKTKHQIISAFMELLEEQHFDNISVSQITSRAMISRSTFYDHYEDKFDLLDSLFDRVSQEFLRITENYFADGGTPLPAEFASRILSYVLTHAKLFRILTSENVPPRNFIQPAVDIIEPYCMQYLETHPNNYKLDNDFIVDLYSNIIIVCVKQVIKKENPGDLLKIINLASHIKKLMFD